MYSVYCSNQPDAMNLLNKLKENEPFQVFLKQAALRKECRSLGLGAFLLEPIQRICKYPLFMKDIVKNTPEDHSDFEDIKKAQESIGKIVDEVNERRRQVENQQKVIAVQNDCDFGDVCFFHPSLCLTTRPPAHFLALLLRLKKNSAW